jgi:hypothetical protein
MTGKIQISVLNYDADEEGNSGFVAFVRSSHCPENLFSKIKIDQFGRTKELIDCNSASREEILLNSGIQGNIDDHTADTKALSVAISGNGYFLIECASGLFLQRSGDFQRQGQELRYGKCHVLNRNGEPFAWSGKELNENGCDLEGACLAIVNPDPKTITSIDRTTFKMTGNNLPQIMTDGRVFLNALENFNDPQSGPTGPNWKEMPPFVPPAECNDVE